GNDNVTFLFLDGDMELILNRMRMRKGHFMKENMVKSQFETLERPDNEPQTLIVSIDGDISDVVERSAAELIKMQASEVA
ncbi:gluconate kinase, partial [Vibrio parahaemolyticus]